MSLETAWHHSSQFLMSLSASGMGSVQFCSGFREGEGWRTACAQLQSPNLTTKMASPNLGKRSEHNREQLQAPGQGIIHRIYLLLRITINYQLSGVECRLATVNYQVLSVGYWLSIMCCSVPSVGVGINHPLSSVECRCRLSTMDCQLSGVECRCRLSIIYYPVSSVGYRL